MNMIMPMTMMAALFTVSKTAYSAVQIVLFCLMAICAVFAIVVILFQPSNSEGLGAISGSQDTFFDKNKGDTLEGKLKKLTVIAFAVLLVFSVIFFLNASEVLLGVGAVIGG